MPVLLLALAPFVVAAGIFVAHVEDMVNIEQVAEGVHIFEHLPMSPEARDDGPEEEGIYINELSRFKRRPALSRAALTAGFSKKGRRLNSSTSFVSSATVTRSYSRSGGSLPS